MIGRKQEIPNRIFNAPGEKVLEKNLVYIRGNTFEETQVSILPEGFYFLEITLDFVTYRTKFVKQ